MQAHFDSIQRIADTTTLPHAMQYLNSRVMEELDVYHLMERLVKGKDQPNPLTSAEKIELWDRLKFLSMNLSFSLFMQLVSFDVGINEAPVVAYLLRGFVFLQVSQDWCCPCGQ